MVRVRRIAQAAIAAGLGISMAFGSIPLAFADPANEPGLGATTTQSNNESQGETKLYVISEQEDLTTSEGAANENMRVSIPVAIHYVANANGTLVGPSDNVVKFVNHSKLSAVHVSKINVEGTGNVKIKVDGNNVTLGKDEMTFYMQPVPGTSDESGTDFTPATDSNGSAIVGTLDQLGYYVDNGSGTGQNLSVKGDWNMTGDNGALALNHLTGRVGQFDTVNAATDCQVGAVHWTVRAGTREQSDARDASVTVHFNANTGSNANGVPIPDQTVQVLDAAQLPTKVADNTGMSSALSATSVNVTVPKSHKNADGTTTTYVFKEWNTKADGSGTKVVTISNLGSATDIAGTVQEVYAIFTEVTS